MSAIILAWCCGALIGLWVGLHEARVAYQLEEPRLPHPAPLDLDAIEAAFVAYWRDFGDARHNLTAAVREYLRVVEGAIDRRIEKRQVLRVALEEAKEALHAVIEECLHFDVDHLLDYAAHPRMVGTPFEQALIRADRVLKHGAYIPWGGVGAEVPAVVIELERGKEYDGDVVYELIAQATKVFLEAHGRQPNCILVKAAGAEPGSAHVWYGGAVPGNHFWLP